MDYVKLYHQEQYIFEDVRLRFEKDRCITAFEFFCIIIWKANRSKSIVAKQIMNNTRSVKGSLDGTVKLLTSGLSRCGDAKSRMRHLIAEWNLKLPMASAVLTVLYPDEFTVYDTRVCDELGDFKSLKDLRNFEKPENFEKLWSGYQDFMSKVIGKAPSELSLRDKDRYLWAKSFHDQLNDDIDKWSQQAGR